MDPGRQHTADGSARDRSTDGRTAPVPALWDQVDRASAAWPGIRWWVLLGAVVIPTMAQLRWLGLSIELSGLVAAGLAVAIHLPRRLVLGSAAALTLALAAPRIGPIAPFVVLGHAALWLVVAGRVAPTTARPRTGPPAALGPLVVASLLLVVRAGLVLPTLLLGIALALLLVEHRWSSQVERASARIERLAAAIGTGAAMVAMIPATLVVLFVWASHQLTRYDPIRPSGGWTPAAVPRRSDRLFGSEHRRPKGVRRVQRGGATALRVAAVVLVAAWVLIPDASPPSSPVFDDEPEYAAVWTETKTFIMNMEFDPVSIYRMGDFIGEHVNQTDGIRRTWTPPACDCERLRVWWFGGSAAWGFYQGDLATLPSQVAREAWDRGYALDIENRAVPGYTLSQEVQRFAWLAGVEEPPDLVIFYDGANELDFQVMRNDRGRGADETPVTYVESLFESAFDLFARLQGLIPQQRAGTPVDADDEGPFLDAPDVAGHAIARYRRGVEQAERTAAAIGADAVFAWQPTQSTADGAYAAFEGVDPWRPEDEAWWQELSRTARSLLPEGTVDLADALDHPEQPVMPDWSHTNATGAQMLGVALVDAIEPRLLALTG